MAVYQIIQSHGKIFDWIRNHKTDIMTYGGIGLMAASTVTACIGTKNMIEEKEEIAKEPNVVKRAIKRGKHFVLSATFFAAGATGIHYSHRISKAENAELADKVMAMAAGTMAYRKRWKDKVGEEKEEEVFFDEKTEEITDENGKKKKVKTTTIDKSISTDVYFDRYSSWMADESGDMDYDNNVLNSIQCMLNNEFRGSPERYLFLERAYELLGVFMTNEFNQRVAYKSFAGKDYGWIYDKANPNGDNTIVLKRTKTFRKLEDGTVIPTWRVSFNVDGNIREALQERGWVK